MVQLVRHDLEFILKQIKIAEAHSAGTPLNQIRIDANGNITDDPDAPLAIPTPLSPYGLRTVNGSYNNLVEGREQWGAAANPFPRVTDPYYRNEGDDALPPGSPPISNNDYGTPGYVVDADPRIISNLIVDQTLENPAAISAALTHAGLTGEPLTLALNEIRTAYAAVKPLRRRASLQPRRHWRQSSLSMVSNWMAIRSSFPMSRRTKVCLPHIMAGLPFSASSSTTASTW
jgi:hypothetical protein